MVSRAANAQYPHLRVIALAICPLPLHEERRDQF
jgi:hypothetical protein